MVRFKSWRDNYLFIKNYGNFSCLNCIHSSSNLDTSVEHSDSEYAHLFCSHHISMIRLDYQLVCAKWKHREDENKELDGCMWDLAENVIETLDKDDRLWSIEEIEELIENESD